MERQSATRSARFRRCVAMWPTRRASRCSSRMFIPTRQMYLLRCASSSCEREIFQHVKASGNTLFAVVFGLTWKHGAPPSSALEDSGKCEKAKFATPRSDRRCQRSGLGGRTCAHESDDRSQFTTLDGHGMASCDPTRRQLLEE